MAGHMNDVLAAIASPDKVIKGSENELRAIIYIHISKLLVVVYK